MSCDVVRNGVIDSALGGDGYVRCGIFLFIREKMARWGYSSH